MLSLAHSKAGLRQKLKVALIIYYIAYSGEKLHVVKMSFLSSTGVSGIYRCYV